ncbi:DUF1993 domain-containing protein [Bradyrhizobium sp. dw_411]|uniref:DUF1993 domain-containing protein n=1 Tax=Bradyrhizobium sp. dw_411 TaxID=2720082 RepID=UPI001BD0D9AC|nr:DUF1993 domain-containing protein [Bradyrhizobium sp. dw_411]
MPLSIYQLSIPTFLRGLAIAGEYCRKASAFCIERGISPSTLIDARLAPDMLTFAGQIQRISDTSKRPTARLAAIDPPRYEDIERTFPELQIRIDKTSDFLRSINPPQLDCAPSRIIESKLPSGGVEHLPAEIYLLTRALPNFYFHLVTAHDILRHMGVSIGKRDYLYLPGEISN